MNVYPWLRSGLFALEAEQAHAITLGALNALAWCGLGSCTPASKPRQVMGLNFPNPVGLAAGLDKDGRYIDGLAQLGFGFIEVGTVTPKPQVGNPKPRVFRLPAHEALINRMGFNNEGVDALVARLQNTRYRGVLGINIGKNATTPLEHAHDDYLEGMRKVYPYASYITVNISSPNTPGLRHLQVGDALEELLRVLQIERKKLADATNKNVPLAVKIAPDLSQEELVIMADAMVRHRIDAVIATNTTLSREGVESSPLSGQQGGLSGAPLTVRSTQVIAQLSQALAGKIPIIAVGGIMSAADARAKMAVGAALVQIYTGLIYRGPSLVREVVEAVGE